MHISVCRFLWWALRQNSADEEEVEHAERMANHWAAINDLVEEGANEKRKLFIPLVSANGLVGDF